MSGLDGLRRMKRSGYWPVTTTPSGQTDGRGLAQDRADRENVRREALRKLAHYAADAGDFLLLSDVLGLDLALLAEDAS